VKKLKTFTSILSLGLLVITALALTVTAVSAKHLSFEFSEGNVSTAVLEAGPFDLHRRYRSMEGPYISFNFHPGDIIASKEVNLPEGLVTFVEGNSEAPAMMGAAANGTMTRDVKGLVDTSDKPRILYWLKGIKLEVLDENDKPLPTAEFICHWNLDVNPNFRNKIFPAAARCETVRLATITQGQTEITFPDGYGVPVASDEPWNAVFQAANRTTDDHRRVKHRCTLYFIKDTDLVYPITALGWYAPWIYVVIDKNSPEAAMTEKTKCPSCLGLSLAVNAPNNTANGVFTDRKGRLLSGHWVIPPGKHTYTATVNDEMEPGFNAKSRTIHAVWSHVHPLCTDLSLYRCEGDSREKIFSTSAKTSTAHGLQIERINYWTSKKGIVLPDKVNYEMQVTYNNTTKVPQDSMATAGMFFEDPTFARPDWVLGAKEGYACSMTNSSVTADVPKTSSNTAEPLVPPETLSLPLFDKNQDGPLLTEAKTVEVKTNAGPLTVILDPSAAPVTATHMYKLFSAGMFAGTRIYRFDPEYLLQVANAEDKATGQAPLSPQSKTMLRRLPLEVSSQSATKLNHQKYVLSMARYPGVGDSATSSFFIMLKDSPHLDREFTIFGKLEEDAATMSTLENIQQNWQPNKYWITGSKTVSNSWYQAKR